ncbi:unnamed protein product, partial [Amoebophrya sp. A25]
GRTVAARQQGRGQAAAQADEMDREAGPERFCREGLQGGRGALRQERTGPCSSEDISPWGEEGQGAQRRPLEDKRNTATRRGGRLHRQGQGGATPGFFRGSLHRRGAA